jgi:hypothetical protein
MEWLQCVIDVSAIIFHRYNHKICVPIMLIMDDFQGMWTLCSAELQFWQSLSLEDKHFHSFFLNLEDVSKVYFSDEC